MTTARTFIVAHPGTDTFFNINEAVLVDIDKLPDALIEQYIDGEDPSAEWYEHGAVSLDRIVKFWLKHHESKTKKKGKKK